MRYLLSLGALALMLAGSNLFASAAPIAHYSAASLSAALSPDVAQWMATAPEQRPSEQPSGHSRVDMRKFASRIFAHTSKVATSLTRSALRFIGVPYVFGGTSVSGFDCSGYVQHVFAIMGVRIPRTADAQYYSGSKTVGGMRPGDLVFFQTYEPGPSHVGIYLGGGRFAHASSSHGVMVSKLSDSYWAPRYIGAKRLVASL